MISVESVCFGLALCWSNFLCLKLQRRWMLLVCCCEKDGRKLTVRLLIMVVGRSVVTSPSTLLVVVEEVLDFFRGCRREVVISVSLWWRPYDRSPVSLHFFSNEEKVEWWPWCLGEATDKYVAQRSKYPGIHGLCKRILIAPELHKKRKVEYSVRRETARTTKSNRFWEKFQIERSTKINRFPVSSTMVRLTSDQPTAKYHHAARSSGTLDFDGDIVFAFTTSRWRKWLKRSVVNGTSLVRERERERGVIMNSLNTHSRQQ